MSEHQIYEFLAIDGPLHSKQMAELRAISTRAEITATRFFNEYNWGDLRADPIEMVRRYFDLHLYQANWGTRRLMLRVPIARIDSRAVRQYFVSDSAKSVRTGRHLILDVRSDVEGYSAWDDEAFELASLAALRTDLLLGDLRGCYLAWLSCAQNGELDEEAREPSVPPGLGNLTSAQQALTNLLRLDPALLRVAAADSEPLEDDARKAKVWVKALPQRTKDRWLAQAIREPNLGLGSAILAEFRKTKKRRPSPARRRRVAELLRALEQ